MRASQGDDFLNRRGRDFLHLKGSKQSPYDNLMGEALSMMLKNIITEAENAIQHFSFSGKGRVLSWNGHNDVDARVLYFD